MTTPATMRKGLFDELERFADRVAIHNDDGHRLTYHELLSMADDLGERVTPNSLVMVVCRNSPAAITGYVGFQRRGCVTMLVNHKTNKDALLALIDAFRPAYLYLPEDLAEGPLPGETIHTLDDYLLRSTGLTIDYAMHEDLAALLGTSGSTGSPEYVRLTHGNLTANTSAIINYLGITASDRAITTMPMSYSYGLSIINTHLASGGCIITTETTLMEKSFWTLLRDAEATTFGGVPFIYQMLKRLRFERMHLPALRYITQAGGRLGVDLCRDFATICREKSLEFIVMYGQTEATARIAYVPADQALEKAGAIGIAIPGGHLWLTDETGRPISNGDQGELVYEGANVSLGNASNRHALNDNDQNRGQLFTGDIGYKDADGYFYIVGRKSRFVKIFGNRVALDDVEHLINAAGIEAACSGDDDDMVVFTTDPNNEASIRKLISTHTTISPKGYRVESITQIPRNDAGKIQYARLCETTRS